MKILFLLDEFPATSETFIFNQIVGLKKMGIEVEIVATRKNENEILHPEVKKHGLMKIAHFYDSETSLIKRIGRGLKILLFNAHKKLPYYREPIKLKSLRDLFLVNALLQIKPAPSIAYAHFGSNGILGARLKRWGVFKGRLITVFHGYDISAFPEEKGGKIYDQLFQEGDLFLPVSKFWKRKLIELGCPKRKIIVHRMGIDINAYEFPPKSVGQEGCIRLLTVARFVEKKGLEFSLKAFAKVVKKLEGVKLQYFIIGDGKLRQRYEDIIEREGLKNRVFLLGWQTQDRVKNLMDRCHVFILPSVIASNGDMEGIPVSLMEAMATGMPVTSTYHSGIPELVENGKSGFLVPEKDVEALAERLEYLITHTEIWAAMARAGRKFVEEHHDINKLNRRLVEIYETSLSCGTSKPT